ncbi:MAG: MBL fold metallo-hydrolase [Planctomycetota bacterium]
MFLAKLVVGPFAENSYVIGDEAAREGALVDPGGDVEELLEIAKNARLKVGKILITHAHWDHVFGVAEAKRLTGAETILPRGERKMLEALDRQSEMMGLPAPEEPEIDRWVDEGDTIEIGSLEFRVMIVPGHSPGHGAFISGLDALSGDTLMAGSVGRTDLPGGNFEVFADSITNKILKLPDKTRIHPGHGPSTTVGKERDSNPFVLEMLSMRSRR